MPQESDRFSSQAAAELRATLGKLELALAAIPEALAWVGPTGNVQWCNGRLDALLALPRLSILGRPLTDVLKLERDGAPVPAHDHPIAKASAQGEFRGEYSYAGGLTIEVTARLVSLTPSERGFVVVCRDVTQRKRHEAASLRLAAIAESTDDAIWAAGFDGLITDWNRAAEELYGYPAQEALGKHISLILPEGRKRELDEAFEKLRRGERIPPYEAERRRKDGGRIVVWVRLSAIRDASGSAIGVSAVVRDLSERMKAEEELRRVNERLAEAFRELEAFSYSVAHDLKSPLRSIVSFTELFMLRWGKALEEAARRPLEQALTAGYRMRDIIDDLGRLSMASFGEFRREELDLSATAASIVQSLKAAEPHRSVEVSIAPGLTVDGAPGLLRIALENLLANAWKFTSRRPDAKIEFGAENGVEGPVYFVRDNGAGFDPAKAEDLFVPFKRLHGADFAGTGIGLSIVRRIIQRHGGRVWAQSSPGAGASFFFTIGASRELAAGRPAASRSAEDAPRCDRLVLVVDDSAEDAELAKLTLAEAAPSCRVEHASGGEKALARLRAGGARPAVVLLDLQMPGMSGFEVLAAIRADAALRGQYVAIFSSSKEPRDVERGKSLGADLHLEKPAGLEGYMDVARRVAAIVERRAGPLGS